MMVYWEITIYMGHHQAVIELRKLTTNNINFYKKAIDETNSFVLDTCSKLKDFMHDIENESLN